MTSFCLRRTIIFEKFFAPPDVFEPDRSCEDQEHGAGTQGSVRYTVLALGGGGGSRRGSLGGFLTGLVLLVPSADSP